MQLRNSKERYGIISQIFHWSIVAVVLIAWTSGSVGEDLPRSLSGAILSLHISLGLAALFLTVLRLVWRFIDPPPPLEITSIGKWAEHAAVLIHYALYALVIATPVVGIGVQFAGGNSLSVFGIAEISSPLTADRAFSHALKEIHEMLANTLLTLAGIHAAAALVHHWIFQDRTLQRMLP